jgi:phosphoribosylformimino-5-aminoimidazole carboxamide ribotide isomerase
MLRSSRVQLYPAIDLRGGQCVRLRQGDYSQETVFSDDPVAIARRWVDAGATALHLVDLDGARDGRPINGSSIRRIVESCGVSCQLGGGLRTEDDIRAAFDWGVARVILGTRALQDPDWLEGLCRRHPNKILLGVDAKGGQVATNGWHNVSSRTAIDLAKQCATWPLGGIVYTDISRDGMLEGPNVDALAEMDKAVPLPIIASGGVTTLDDIRRLHALGLAGCIIGRALYEGRIDLAKALAITQLEH